MKHTSLLFVLLLLTVNGIADQGEIGTGTRAAALANNHTALSSGIADCYWNPGALAFSVTREFQMSLYGIKLQNTSTFKSTPEDQGTSTDDVLQRFRIGSAGFSFAVPASRGGMSIAGSFSNPIIFDDAFSFTARYLSGASGDSLISLDRTYRITGNLDFWTLGTGIQVAKNCGLGCALSLVTGKSKEDSYLNKNTTVNSLTSNMLNDYTGDGGYTGYDFRAGFMYTADKFTTGLRLVIPRILQYNGSSRGTYASSYFSADDRYRMYSSYSGAWGITANYPFFTFTAEARTTLPYDYMFPEEKIPSGSQAKYFKSGGGAGLEVPLPGTRALVRAGYSYDELDLHPWIFQFYRDFANSVAEPIDWSDNGVTVSHRLQRFSCGLGFTTATSSLDISYSLSTWGITTRQHLEQIYYLHRILTSFAVRF